MATFFQDKNLQNQEHDHEQEHDDNPRGKDDLRAFHEEIGLVAPAVSAAQRRAAMSGIDKVSMPGVSKGIASALQLSSGKKMRLNAEKTLNSASNTALKAGLKGLIALSRIQSDIEDENLDSQRRLQMTGPSKASQGLNATELIRELIQDMKDMSAEMLQSKKQDETQASAVSVRESILSAVRVLSRISSLAKRLIGRESTELNFEVSSEVNTTEDKESEFEQSAEKISSQKIKQIYKLDIEDED